MGKYWTMGLAWGILAWILYYVEKPMFFLLKMTIGLPVLCAGYLGLVIEMFIVRVPDIIMFCLSLPLGILLCWFISYIFDFSTHKGKRLRKSGVE